MAIHLHCTYPVEIMSCNLSFSIGNRGICKTANYTLTNRRTALGVYSVAIPKQRLSLSPIGRLQIADWSVANMNFDATPYGMSLDVRVYRQKNIYPKIYNFNKMHQRIAYTIF